MTTGVIITAIVIAVIYLGIGLLAGWITKEFVSEDHRTKATVWWDLRIYLAALAWIAVLVWFLLMIIKMSVVEDEEEEYYHG
jgi:Zn-dependent protease with chaperone function